MLGLLEKTLGAVSDKKREELVDRLKSEYGCSSMMAHLEDITSYEADYFSGFMKFDVAKFIASVLLFCENARFTTILNKLLFYADFLHFKKFTTSITGLKYAHMDRGPAPDKYYSLFALIAEKGLVEIEEVDFGEYSGEKFRSTVRPDREVFEESELLCLLHVKKRFENDKASEISEYSHKESAHKKTRSGEIISYAFAEDLSLDLD
jgi:hypothetical protein